MSDFDIKEKRFEQDIEEYLITEGGYEKGDPRKFDRKLALDTETFLKFIKISQPKQWERYEKIYGTASEKQVVERFCREVLLRWIKSFYRLKAIMKRRISGMDMHRIMILRHLCCFSRKTFPIWRRAAMNKMRSFLFACLKSRI